MKLVELIEEVKTIDAAKAFVSQRLPNVEFDTVDVYLVGNLSEESEVRLFDAEKISNTLTMNFENVTYVNLFPLYLVQEMVQEYVVTTNGKISNEEIAKQLLNYRVKDA